MITVFIFNFWIFSGGGGRFPRGALIRGRLIQFLDCRGSLIREGRLFERGAYSREGANSNEYGTPINGTLPKACSILSHSFVSLYIVCSTSQYKKGPSWEEPLQVALYSSDFPIQPQPAYQYVNSPCSIHSK